MKTKIPLVLSIALNIVLAAFLLRPQPAVEPTVTRDETVDSGIAGARPNSATRSPSAETVTNTVVRQFNWETVESPDYREYIKNLRSIGVPEETIRDIIIADVNKLYAEKKKQARGEPKKFEFWKTGNPMAAIMGDPETVKAVRALEQEKNGVLTALGIEPNPMDALLMATAGGNPMDTMFSFLPEEKRSQVVKIQTERQSKIMDGAKDAMSDPSAILKAQKEMENAIKAVLTPEEFLDYQLRFSTTAMMMRMQLPNFEPSEQEFLDVFKLRTAFDEEHSLAAVFNATTAEQKARTEAQSQLNEQIKNALGDDRYAEYERAQDFGYQQLTRITKQAELDTSIAINVYDMQKIAQDKANQIRSNQDLQPDQRQAALQAVRAETERSIQQTMGDKGWDLYNRPQNTYWLRGIASDAPTETNP